MWKGIMKKGFRTPPPCATLTRRSYKPFLERLEDRYLLSNFAWNWQAGNDNWSTVGNWLQDGGIATRYPGQNNHTEDTVQFDSTSGNPCTVDVSPTIDAITISASYGSNSIDISAGQTLEVIGAPSWQAGGRLFVNGTFKIGDSSHTTASILLTKGNIQQQGTVLVYGMMTISGSGGTLFHGGVTLDDFGEVTWQDGEISLNGGATIKIEGSGIFNADTPSNIVDSGGTGTNKFYISAGNDKTKGLFANPGSNNTTTMGVFLQAAAGSYITVQTGTLQTTHGSDLGGTIYVTYPNGVITPSTLSLASADPNPDKLDGCTITTDISQGSRGNAKFNGGHVSVVKDSTIEIPVTDSSVLVDGSGNLTIGDMYDWLGPVAVWSGSGKMIITSFGKLTIDGLPTNDYALGRTIDNSGTVIWTANSDISVSNGANIINESAIPGGTFTIETDHNILNGGGAGSFQNKSNALLQKTAGTGNTRIDITILLYNGGKLDVHSGTLTITPFLLNLGTITISASNAGMVLSAGYEQDSGSTSISSGGGETIRVSGGNFALKGGTVSVLEGGTISVTGQYQQTGGSTTLGGPSLPGGEISVTDQIIVSANTLEMNVGTLSATNGVMINSGATLQGPLGQIFGSLTNSGIVNTHDPGGVGTLIVSGNYTENAGGVLNMDIALSGYTGTSDLLQISGTAYLGGILNVFSIGSNPIQGSFQIITWGSRLGTFATINLPGSKWSASYGANGLGVSKSP